MSGSIFIVHNENQLIELKESKYDNEDLFQALIEKYPKLLAGDQIDPDNPRKWIFISREMGVPSYQPGGSQWFLDHLFIDQGGIPTFVEVKRSTDTRIRREVVAQMLDYAANATLYWPIDMVRETYEKNTEHENNSLLDLGIEKEQEESFWQNVNTNLRSGKIRLLFVADEIPMSLQRIIEFLNEQMSNTEVLGLEIKQFISASGIKTLVPCIIGRTANAVQVKKIDKGFWDEESLLADIERLSGKEAVSVCSTLIKRFENLGCRTIYGQGKTHGSCYIVYEAKESHTMIGIYPYYKNAKDTYIRVEFQRFKHPFNSIEKQCEIKEKLAKIKGLSISDNRLKSRLTFDWSLLKSSESMEIFISAFVDYISKVKNIK